MPDVNTPLADIILSRAVCEGREGGGVTAADRDCESYLHCQLAADMILDHIRDHLMVYTERLEVRR